MLSGWKTLDMINNSTINPSEDEDLDNH